MSAMLREPALLKQLKEQAETHAIELRAYEATVANLEQRIREIEAERHKWQRNSDDNLQLARDLIAERDQANARLHAVLPAGHPLQRLGGYLSSLLDEDQWATAEQYLLAAWAERVPEGWIKCSDRLPAPYQHVVGLWRYAKGVTEMEVTMYEYDGVWFESKEPEYWFPFPAAPAQEKV